MAPIGSIAYDESANPVLCMRYEGTVDDAAWAEHIDHISEWAHRGVSYAVVIDARKVGRVPASQRKAIVDWINRDRLHLTTNCAGGALVFSNPIQRGLWTAIMWLTPIPIPVRVFRDIHTAEEWLMSQLHLRAS